MTRCRLPANRMPPKFTPGGIDMPTMIQDKEIAGMAYLGKEICGLAAGGSIGFVAAPVIYSAQIAEKSVPANTPFHITAKLNRISSRTVAYNAGTSVGLSQDNVSIAELEDGTKEYRSTIAVTTPGLRSIDFYARDAGNNQSAKPVTAAITITLPADNDTQTDPDIPANA